MFHFVKSNFVSRYQSGKFSQSITMCAKPIKNIYFRNSQTYAKVPVSILNLILSMENIKKGPSGLEPPTFWLTAKRSNQLSYEPKIVNPEG
jgi:hypothetical protein